MPKKKKILKARKKTAAKKVKVAKAEEVSLKKTIVSGKGRILQHLERDIVKQNEEEIPLEHIADEEEELSENPKELNEGLGIEEDEKKGEEPYPEIAEAEKDPDEEEEE
jgi:hypothetical protein